MEGLKSLFELPLFLRQRRLAAARARMTKEHFVSEASSTALGKAAASILWDKLITIKSHSDFSPYPSDNLLTVYGLAEEDLDVDIIFDIITRLNCRVPDQATVDALGPVTTPADVVRFVERSCSRSGDT